MIACNWFLELADEMTECNNNDHNITPSYWKPWADGRVPIGKSFHKFPPQRKSHGDEWKIWKLILCYVMADLVFYWKIMINALFYDARAISKAGLDTITPALLQC